MKWQPLFLLPVAFAHLLGKSIPVLLAVEPGWSEALTIGDSRFVDDAFGFALTWNYWFNDAVSTAADLVALQLVLEYWTTNFPGWALSLIFWVILIAINIITVRLYGEV